MKKSHLKLGKFLCLVLRHRPEVLNLQVEGEGWAYVNDLITQVNLKEGYDRLNRIRLEEIVSTDNKTRFAFNEDHSMIRASQGHSIQVNLNYKPSEPPEFLYHGTVERFLDSIKRDGLKKMQRHHVHLSVDLETATNVGGRRGKPVVLKIAAREMYKADFEFFISANGVWLTDFVPAGHIIYPEGC